MEKKKDVKGRIIKLGEKTNEDKPFTAKDITDIKILIEAKGQFYPLVTLPLKSDFAAKEARFKAFRDLLKWHGISKKTIAEIMEEMKMPLKKKQESKNDGAEI